MNFRQEYVKDLPMRLLDFLLHCLVGFAIAGLSVDILCQWLPDIMLPFIWIWSMFTGKRLPTHNFFLKTHINLHDWPTMLYLSFGFMLGGMLSQTATGFILALNLVVHSCIDKFTHEGVR